MWALAVALLAGPDPWIDGPLTLGAAGAWAGLAAVEEDLADPSCPCARGDVNPFDRHAVDLHVGGAERSADALVAVTLLGAPLAAAASGEAADALLVAEAAAITGLLTESAKVLVSRPYPYMYSDRAVAAQDGDGVNYASFWSGHTAVPMAAAVALARLVERRHPTSPARWVAWTLGPVLALGAGALQIAAGNHFPTDVATGALVGAAVGWTVVELH
jgi:membrane-associated phospholipid phosphatase